MSRRVLISGSVAFDTIMVFDGYFKDHILADKVHMLNVAFLTPRLKREFGGCAANIAYNLKMLGGEPIVLATVGHDGGDYLERIAALGIDTSHLVQLNDQFTAQAFITTDLADNQIIAFHPGAMSLAHQVSASGALPATLGIVSPNGKDAMLQHAREFHEAGIPFIFDPGQGLPMFGGPELEEFVRLAEYVTVNDYEAQMLQERTGIGCLLNKGDADAAADIDLNSSDFERPLEAGEDIAGKFLNGRVVDRARQHQCEDVGAEARQSPAADP